MYLSVNNNNKGPTIEPMESRKIKIDEVFLISKLTK